MSSRTVIVALLLLVTVETMTTKGAAAREISVQQQQKSQGQQVKEELRDEIHDEQRRRSRRYQRGTTSISPQRSPIVDSPVTTVTVGSDEFELYYPTGALTEITDWYKAAEFCQSKSNRFLAAPRNYKEVIVLATLPSVLSIPSVMVMAGNDVALNGTWRWAGGGRWDGWLFSDGGSPTGDFGVEWLAGQPNEAPGHDYTFMSTKDEGGFTTFSSHADTPDGVYYVCERQACNADDDCNGHGTATGDYYPDCSCSKCDDGWSGDHCETLEVQRSEDPPVSTIFKLQYSALPISYTEASDKCEKISSGGAQKWYIAILTDKSIIGQLTAHTLRGSAWVGVGSGGIIPGPEPDYSVVMNPDGSFGDMENSWTSEIHYYYCSSTVTS